MAHGIIALWEKVKTFYSQDGKPGLDAPDLFRMQVPGGWLVRNASGTGDATYLPDVHHEWLKASPPASTAVSKPLGEGRA